MARSDAALGPVIAALGRGILGAGYTTEVAVRMLEGIDGLPSGFDRNRLKRTLKLLGTRSGALALTGSATPVSWLSPARAERVLKSWQHSKIADKRKLFLAIDSLATSSLYGYPGKEWERIGYQGPMGPAPDEPKRLTPLDLQRDEVLECDFVIVGSGAGGGCSAAILSEAGFDVVVIEKGGYLAERDFEHLEAEATRDMYLYGMRLATTDLGVQIIAGSTLGGGTVVNYSTSFKTPDLVLAQWAEESGIDAFVSGEIEASLDAAAERLGVNTDSSAAGKRDVLLEEGLKRLGWHVDALPRAVRGCTQDERCGFCGFGCRVGAKQSSMRTWLEDAQAAGARIVVGADVRRVRIDDGRATGIEATLDGKRIAVNAAKGVIVAAGAIESPALLLRSGLRGRVGHDLRLHPGNAAFGVFDDDVRIWEGTLQARYSAEFRSQDDGYGPIFETVPVHPGSGSVTVPWAGAAEHRSLMADFGKLSFCAVLPRDKTSGRVRIGKDGQPRVEYRTVAGDERRLTEGLINAGKVMEAAGARSIYTLHHSPIRYQPNGASEHEAWAEQIRARGMNAKVITGFSYHQMGSCRMGLDPSSSAIDENNETHEVRDLFVMDSSAFPTASGVNPMLSIYGIAHRAVTRLAARHA